MRLYLSSFSTNYKLEFYEVRYNDFFSYLCIGSECTDIAVYRRQR